MCWDTSEPVRDTTADERAAVAARVKVEGLNAVLKDDDYITALGDSDLRWGLEDARYARNQINATKKHILTYLPKADDAPSVNTDYAVGDRVRITRNQQGHTSVWTTHAVGDIATIASIGRGYADVQLDSGQGVKYGQIEPAFKVGDQVFLTRNEGSDPYPNRFVGTVQTISSFTTRGGKKVFHFRDGMWYGLMTDIDPVPSSPLVSSR